MKKFIVLTTVIFLLQSIAFATLGDLRDAYFSDLYKNLLIIKNSSLGGIDAGLENVTDGYGNQSPLYLSATDFRLGDTSYEPDAKFYFRDANTYIYSPSSTNLEIFGSAGIELSAPALTLTGATSIVGNTAVTGTLEVSGTSELTGAVTIGGIVGIGANFLNNDGITAKGLSFDTIGNATFAQTLTTAAAAFGNTDITGTLDVSGVTALAGNIGIGANYLSNDGDSEGITIGDTGNVRLYQTLTTIGNTASSNTAITGTLSVSTTSTLTGKVSIASGLEMTTATGQTLDIAGNTLLIGEVDDVKLICETADELNAYFNDVKSLTFSGTTLEPIVTYDLGTVGNPFTTIRATTGYFTNISATGTLEQHGDATFYGNIIMTNGKELDLYGCDLFIDADKDTKIFESSDDVIGIELGGSPYLTIAASVITPAADNSIDLGVDGTSDFKDGFFQGALKSASLTTTAAITSGSTVTVGTDIAIGGSITTSGVSAWRLIDNSLAALTIGSVGATDILEICTTDGAEFVEFNAAVKHTAMVEFNENILRLAGTVGVTSDRIYATGDEIYFGINSVDQVKVTDGTFEPITDSDIALGTVGKSWSNIYSDNGTFTSLNATGIDSDDVTADNINITGNTIISTDTNGDIVLDPNGTGNISIGGDIVPDADDTYDLGIVGTNEFKDLYIDGIAYIDEGQFILVDIDGGDIDEVNIGVNTPATALYIDNLYLNGNTIVSTDTNGDITIAPDGDGDINLTLGGSGKVVATRVDAGEYLIIDVGINDVDNPPTDAQLDGIFGTPATVGSGFTSYIDDNGGGAHFYQVISDGTNWWTIAGAKAL